MFQSITVIADLIFSDEVTEKVSVWNLREAAAYVTFHEGKSSSESGVELFIGGMFYV